MSDLFDFDKPVPRYAVMGNPVTHSKSPQIHSLFAQQLGLRLDYQKIQVDPGGFEQAVANFRANGGCGLNITLPFKQAAWQLADQLSPRAQLAQAVNTISFTATDQIVGDNTDGVGLKRDITANLGYAIRARRLLVVGAGGAVRGVLGPLLEDQPELLVVANRTVDTAIALAEQFKEHGPVHGCGLDDVSDQQFDIVINGTSASVQGQVPALPAGIFRPGALAYDMMYGDEPTAFLIWAERAGADQTTDGLGMLVEQAAESFFIWHGQRPNTPPVLGALRDQ